MRQSYRTMLIQAIFVSFLFIGFGPVADVMGSIHRVRVDLKVRSPNLLKEKAEAMSKPFPHRGNPLSWPEVIEIAGRTKDEIKQLVTKLSNDLHGKNIKECPSKQCIVADVDVDDERILEDGDESSDGETSTDVAGVEDFVDRRLRRSLEDSGHDHTIISGVRRISMPNDDENDYSSSRRRNLGLDETDVNKNAAKENMVFLSILMDIADNRQEVTKESLNNAIDNYQFLLLPAICAFDNTTGYYSMEKAQSRSRSSCPTQIKLTVSPWYAEDLAVSENITYTIFTEDLEQTDMCSEYNQTTCKNSLETIFPATGGPIGIYSGYSAEDGVVFKFRNNTVLRIFEIGQFLDPGIAYYNIQVEYPEWGIFTNTTNTGTVYSGPMITPDYGKQVYNVPEGHQAVGLGVTALFLGGPNVFSKDALSAFLNGFDLTVPEIQLFESSVFQGNNLSLCYEPEYAVEGCGESDLDVQSITSYGVGAEFGFLPGGQQLNQTSDYELFVYYREAFIENDVTPDVLSLSFGGPLFSIPGDFDDIAMEFTAVGITVLASTGDRGAAGADFSGPCSPTNYYPVGATIAPAGSPWILSVGATMEADLLESDGLGPAACMAPIGGQITSAGLIQPSEAAALPDYQKAAVEGYLNSDAYKYWPFKASFSGEPGRGIPDVAGYGNNIPIVNELQNGKLQTGIAGGTSASSPAFAGLLLQVRGALLSSPECEGIDVKFGHINPMIYWAAENRPDAFIDITVGNNVFDGQLGAGYNTEYCGFGYVATEGWDPVTGVGMMNFPAFVEAAKEYYCTGF